MDVQLTPRQLDFVEHLDGERRRRFLEDVWRWVAGRERVRGATPPPDALVPEAMAAVLSRPEWVAERLPRI